MNDDPRDDEAAREEALRVQRALRLTKPPPAALAARLNTMDAVDRLLQEPWLEPPATTRRPPHASSPQATAPPSRGLAQPVFPPQPAVSLPPDEALRARALDAVHFAVLDFETTGLYPAINEIIDFAVFDVFGGFARFVDASLVRPEGRLPFEITALTGIDADMLVDAPPLHEAMPRLRAALAGRVLVAHNASFDLAFLNRALRDAGHDDFAEGVLCTRRLARRLRPDLPKRSLDALADAYGIRNHARHRARGDAAVTADLLVELLRQAQALGVRTLGDLEALCNAPPPRHVDFSRYAFGPARIAHLPTGPGVYRMLDAAGEVFYVGKARNLRTRVGSYFRGRGRGKAALVRERLYDFDLAPTDSELEALLLEAAEIRALRPALNVQVNVRRRGLWFRVSERAGQVRIVSATAAKEPGDPNTHGPFTDGGGGREAARALRLAFELACPPVYPRVSPHAFLQTGAGVEVLTRALETALARIAAHTDIAGAEALRHALRTVRRIAAQRAHVGDAHHRRDLLLRLPGSARPRLFLFRDGHPVERLPLEADPTEAALEGLARHLRATLRTPSPALSRELFEADAHLLLDDWLARHGAQACVDLGDIPPRETDDATPDPLVARIRALVRAPSPADVAVLA